MSVWKVQYTSPEHLISDDTAIVHSPTAGGAIKKCCKELKLGPHRINKVERIVCDKVLK